MHHMGDNLNLDDSDAFVRLGTYKTSNVPPAAGGSESNLKKAKAKAKGSRLAGAFASFSFGDLWTW